MASQSTSAKHRQVARLVNQLNTMSQRMDHLDQLVAVTAEQAKYIRLLGGYHAAWFMGASAVLTPATAANEQPEDDKQ